MLRELEQRSEEQRLSRDPTWHRLCGEYYRNLTYLKRITKWFISYLLRSRSVRTSDNVSEFCLPGGSTSSNKTSGQSSGRRSAVAQDYLPYGDLSLIRPGCS